MKRNKKERGKEENALRKGWGEGIKERKGTKREEEGKAGVGGGGRVQEWV